ncbi:cryptochrome/photolyase family protein [Chitinophagaceae bacterium IBVUCB2]|nr:cryptochrome/photolyase family protein [Chitinophagaceae bacterium IBVUCB2]
MKSATIIFPHQLYSPNPATDIDRFVFLVEEYLYFRQYNFHKQKLVLHRASMKQYEELLIKSKIAVRYIESAEKIADIRLLIPWLKNQGIEEIHYTDTTDYWLEKRINYGCENTGINTSRYPSPNFLNQLKEVDDYFNKKTTYFQTDFYIQQRKQRKLLLDKHDKPVGGKWTFDTENRVKFPKGEKIPAINYAKDNSYIKEAKDYVDQFFPANYGNTDHFIYATNTKEAEQWLDDFLDSRITKFGIYEDAMVKKESFLFHSVLTPYLNIGLLNPQQVIDKTLNVAEKNNIPINSLEGFIRQLAGWREFIRIVYEREGRKQRTTNYWNFKRKIPATFWTGETGIHPIDIVIKKVLKTGYSHHIERLMVLGNFMLLCEFDPDEVYKWFMEMYIDSYDWVMVPNTYGMTQFADGGLMTTKPYISGSNYLLKMGDWEKGDWQTIWDGLFWRFMHVHRTFFKSNPRLGMLVNMFDKMPAEKRNTHLKIAEQYLASLDK